jgi:hypothetical protein
MLALGTPPQPFPANQKLLYCTDEEQLAHLKNNKSSLQTRLKNIQGKGTTQYRITEVNVTHSMLQNIRFITASLIIHTGADKVIILHIFQFLRQAVIW